MADTPIEVGADELRRREIDLDGGALSSQERKRGEALDRWLGGIAPRLVGDAAAAVHVERAEVRFELGDAEGAREAAREASQSAPGSYLAAWTWRRFAAPGEEAAGALEREAETASEEHRAILECERGLRLEALASAATAPAYREASASGSSLAAAALERLALQRGQPERAAEHASAAAAQAPGPLRTELLARGALHRVRAGDVDGAVELAQQALAEGIPSPTVELALEALVGEPTVARELVGYRLRQLERDAIDRLEGWFDVGVIARYRLDDGDLALEAFGAALAAARDEVAQTACHEELLPLLVDGARWDEAIGTAEVLAAQAASPMRRAHLQERIASWRLEHHGDEEGALNAYRQALREEPSHRPSLEGAGRILQRQGATEELVRMHRREALAADDERDAAAALRRAGEILVADASSRGDGIAMLEEARVQDPDHLGAFEALARALEVEGDAARLCELLEREADRTRSDPGRRGVILARVAELATVELGDAARGRRALRALEESTAAHAPGSLDAIAERLRAAEDWDGLVLVIQRRAEHRSSPALEASDWVEIAQVHERRGDERAAVAALRRAVDVAPPTHAALSIAGRTFLRLGLHAELLPLLELGSQRGTPVERADWLGRMARILDERLGRPSEAIDRLVQARDLAPTPALELHLEALLVRERRWVDLAVMTAAEPLRRGMWAEAADRVDASCVAYAEAAERGHPMARRLRRRALAAAGRWAELEGVEESRATEDLEARLRALQASLHRGPSDEARAHLAHLVHGEAPPPWLAPALVLAPPEASTVAEAGPLNAALSRLSEAGLRSACMHLLLHRGAAQMAAEALLDVDAAHPVALPLVVDAARRGGRLGALTERLRGALGAETLAGELRAPLRVLLAEARERLGALQEALDALLDAREALSRRGWVARHRIARALEREEEMRRALEALAAMGPEGPERAVALRLLDAQHPMDGVLTQALRTNPRDYEALRDLRRRGGETEDYTDALTRAFENEEDEGSVAALGNALTAQLLREGRYDRGHSVSERVLAIAPGSLEGLMLRAEIDERRQAYAASAEALDAIAGHAAVTEEVRLEAQRRRALLGLRRLEQADEAQRILDALAPEPSAAAQEVRLEIAGALGDRKRLVEVLSQLAHHPQLDEADRGGYALRLSTAHEGDGDVEAAFATLAGVAARACGRRVVERCFALAMRTERWVEACPIIEQALDEVVEQGEDHAWVVAMRTRLVRVLREHVGDEEGAARQEAILDATGTSEPADLAQLAAACAEAEPGRALGIHRKLLSLAPHETASYRRIRELALRLGDEATAFRAEAVLVGLGIATDEEHYFYKQRRGRRLSRVDRLSDALRDAMLPEGNEPGLKLLRLLDPLLADVFPLVPGQYGAHPDQAEPSLVETAASVADWFGIERYQLVVGAARLRPAVAWGQEPLLVVPRTLGDALVAEQRFVFAGLLARVALGVVATDVAREQALTNHELTAWLEAGRCLALGWPAGSDPIVRDLFERLRQVAGAEVREALERLAPILEAEVLDGEAVREAGHRAAARGAMLGGGDPGVSLRCMGPHGVAFGAREDGTWPAAGWAGAAFLVSAAVAGGEPS